jgi:hypothetical protein
MTWNVPTYDQWGATPAGYEPERWNVVRDDGLALIEGTTILDADTQVAWLNARMQGRHSYSTQPTEQG